MLCGGTDHGGGFRVAPKIAEIVAELHLRNQGVRMLRFPDPRTRGHKLTLAGHQVVGLGNELLADVERTTALLCEFPVIGWLFTFRSGACSNHT